MAVTYAVAATSTRGTNPASFTVAYPALTRVSAGDVAILSVLYKPTTKGVGTVSAPGDWTALGNTGHRGSGAANGSDTGDSIIYNWYKVLDGSETGSVTITFSEGTVGVASGYMYALNGIGQGGWDLEFRYAGTDTAAASQSESLDSALDLQVDDLVYLQHATPTDIQANPFSNQAISASGATFSAFTEIADSASSSGSDSTVMWGYWTVTAGSSSDTPVVSFDIAGTNTNQLGPISVVRARKPVLSTVDEVQVVAGTPSFNSGAASVTPTAPTHAADDVLVAFALAETGTAFTASAGTSGWTLLWDDKPTGATSAYLLAYYKVATGSSETIPTFSLPGATAVACVLSLQGADTADVLDVAAATEFFAAGLAGNDHAAVTTTEDLATVVHVPIFSNDLDYMARDTGWDCVLRVKSNLLNDLNVQVYEKQQATAGSSGALTLLQESLDQAYGFSFAVNYAATAQDVEGSGTSALSLAATGYGSHAHNVDGTLALSLTPSGAGTHAHSVDGTTALTLGITGAAAQGAVNGSGTDALALSGTGSATHDHPATGTAALALDTVGDGYGPYRASGSGTAALSLDASGQAAITVQGDGSGLLVLGTDGGTALMAVSGGGSLVFEASGSGAATHDHPGSGTDSLGIDAWLVTGDGRLALPSEGDYGTGWPKAYPAPSGWSARDDDGWETVGAGTWPASDNDAWNSTGQDGW